MNIFAVKMLIWVYGKRGNKRQQAHLLVHEGMDKSMGKT